MKKIAVLTSGGDAPGMNACLRAIVRAALYNDMEIYGVKKGFYGLVHDEMELMGMRSVSDIIQRGGTILHTARCQGFHELEGQKLAAENLRKRGIEGVVVLGGDGSFRGAKDLCAQGIPTIGIPATIDNDLAYTDFTLGFDTAINTCIDIINKLRDTMNSHERISIVEVMGRNCGDIALYAGLAGGAEVIIIPEKKITIDEVVEKIHRSRERGKKSNIIVLAEGAGEADKLGEKLSKLTHYSFRSTIVGHIQRGGAPTVIDRVLASQFGYHAVELLKEGKKDMVVGVKDNKIFSEDINKALSKKGKFNAKLYEISQNISM